MITGHLSADAHVIYNTTYIKPEDGSNFRVSILASAIL